MDVPGLSNHVDLRANISLYEIFDVLLFDETNCKLVKYAHGISGIALGELYDPILRKPMLTSEKV
jgi:sRNA-binding regulator protein Hfq